MTAVRTSTSTIGSDVLSVLILLASAGAAVAAVVLPMDKQPNRVGRSLSR